MAVCGYFVPVFGQNDFKKMFIIFLILNEFSCGKIKNFVLLAAKEYLMFLYYILYFSTQLRANSFIHCSSLCGKTTACLKMTYTLYNDSLQKCKGICSLPHENSLSIQEIMINFLTRSVRTYVQNVT